MKRKPNLVKNQSRRLVFTALIFLLVLLGSTSAGAQPAFMEAVNNGNVFTGCVNQNSGVLRNVAIGIEPAKDCNDEEFQITWDRG